MKISSKKLRRILPENVKMEVIYTGTQFGSQFSIKDPIPKTHNYNIIYRTVYSEDNCNENYIGKCARSLKERTKDHNSRDKNSHVLRQSIESRYKEVAESDFQIIGKGYFHHNRRKKNLREKSHHYINKINQSLCSYLIVASVWIAIRYCD